MSKRNHYSEDKEVKALLVVAAKDRTLCNKVLKALPHCFPEKKIKIEFASPAVFSRKNGLRTLLAQNMNTAVVFLESKDFERKTLECLQNEYPGASGTFERGSGTVSFRGKIFNAGGEVKPEADKKTTDHVAIPA